MIEGTTVADGAVDGDRNTPRDRGPATAVDRRLGNAAPGHITMELCGQESRTMIPASSRSMGVEMAVPLREPKTD